MKDSNKTRLLVLRSTVTALTNKAVEKGEKPDSLLSDSDVIVVLKKLYKQRIDSAEEYRKVGSKERSSNEEKEAEIIKEYLPEEMSEEEVRVFVEKKKEELGISDQSKMGVLVGAVLKELGEKTNGNTVSKIVKELLGK